MTYRLTVSDIAEESLLDAARWYEQQSAGMGAKFLLAIDDAFFAIQSHPLFYSYCKKNYRMYILRKFPFRIVFLVREDTVLVVSILHTSRKRLI